MKTIITWDCMCPAVTHDQHARSEERGSVPQHPFPPSWRPLRLHVSVWKPYQQKTCRILWLRHFYVDQCLSVINQIEICVKFIFAKEKINVSSAPTLKFLFCTAGGLCVSGTKCTLSNLWLVQGLDSRLTVRRVFMLFTATNTWGGRGAPVPMETRPPSTIMELVRLDCSSSAVW